MNQTNLRLGIASYALSAGGAAGFSLLVLSYAVPPNWLGGNAGNFVVGITNDSNTAPFNVNMRSTWLDQNGVSQTTPSQISYTLTSGQDAILSFTGIAGSALQVWIIAQAAVADAAGCSGQVTLWSI